jgi:hypothetical protein
MKGNWFYNNKYLIGGILIVTAIGVIVYRRLNKKPTENNIIMQEGNSIEEIGNLIYSYPKTKLSSYNVIIVFGGINYANPKWMLKETPKELLSKSIFVFAPYTTSYLEVKKQIDATLAKKSITINGLSVLGFSAGGLNVQKTNLKDFKFIGLIDPSTRAEYTSLPFTSNVKMIYNDSNWGGHPKIKELLPKIAELVKSAGGDSEKVSLSHAKIPSYFFNKYKDLIA